MEFLFWLFLSLIIYCYFGYPVVLTVLAKLLARPIQKADIEPTVSVVISICDEEDVIERKIRNLLALDYPRAKLEVLIGSDCSTDNTNAIIKGIDDSRVRLFEFSERRGKIATLNDLVPQARHEIIFFNDARQRLDNDALRQLVKNFADPRIGCVSGELMFEQEGGATAQGINLYWKYEKFLRSQESRLHSMLGATGAIYAIRRELYVPPPHNVVLDDMYIPFKVIQKGYRAVLEEAAKAYDRAADSPREEHRRKARTLYGNYQIFGLFPEMFNPVVSPVALQLFSHKFLRVVAPFFMIAVFLINWALLDQPIYRLILAAQILFYVMAVIGALARHKKYGILRHFSKACYVPYVFCLLNFSALIGFLRFVRSNQEITWQKARKGD